MLPRFALALFLLPAIAFAQPMVLAPDSSAKPPFTIGKDTTAITSPLNDDGTVDYVGAINQRFGSGVTAEQNGWVLWVQATGESDLPQTTRDTMYRMAAGAALPDTGPVFQSAAVWFTTEKHLAPNAAGALADKLNGLRLHLWTVKDAPEIADYLDAQRKPLDLIVQAAMRPRWWMPFVSNDGRSTYGVLLPGLSNMRQAAYALCARANLRGAAGDFNGALADITAVKHLARRTAPTALITTLVALVIDQAADQSIAALAAQGNLTSAQLAALQNLVDTTGALDGVHDVVDIGERWEMLDIAALLATDKLFKLRAGSQFSDTFAGIDPARVDWDAVLRRINADVDETLRILAIADPLQQDAAFGAFTNRLKAALPSPPPRDATPKPGESRDAYTARIIALFEADVLPSFGRIGSLRHRELLAHDLTRTFLAAAAFKSRTGHWPQQLTELVPSDLPALPRDFHNNPPSYTLTKDGPSLTAAADVSVTLGVTSN